MAKPTKQKTGTKDLTIDTAISRLRRRRRSIDDQIKAAQAKKKKN